MSNTNENKKIEDFYNVLRILENEFKECNINNLNQTKQEKKEDNIVYYEELKKNKGIDVLFNEYTTSLFISKKYEIDHNTLMGIIKKLETLYYIINIIKYFNTHNLTEEGNIYLKEGSPEYITLKFISDKKKCTVEEIKNALGKKGEIGLSLNLKNKLIELNKNDKTVSCKNDKLKDTTKDILEIINKHGNDINSLYIELQKIGDKNDLKNNSSEFINNLKKRKLVEIKKNTYSYIIKTSEFKIDIKKEITDLTYSLLKNSEYEKYNIKKYNFFSSGKKIYKGNYHLLSKQIKYFKQIFLSLGFEEMQTNTYVESSFWCFDALYIPQQHPSRDLQDTFFIKTPEYCIDNFTDLNYIENVKRVHSIGDYESFGWKYDWNINETKKNVLRTHTTANSARTLFNLAKEYKEKGYIIPKKYFSIDKVFRNENLDSTHLAEFHQIEGLIIDKNLGLAHLIGILSTFYQKIGIKKLKFKPAFNPYTEPSMEIYGYHEQHKKWLEVGNSGIFRPEMLRSMGFSNDVSVIAWGLSLERPTMIKYDIKNIRDLFGYKSIF